MNKTIAAYKLKLAKLTKQIAVLVIRQQAAATRKSPKKPSKEVNTKEEVVYEEDDCGVRCRFTNDGGWEAIEPHCLNCGYTCEVCSCDDYKEAYWVNEDEEE